MTYALLIYSSLLPSEPLPDETERAVLDQHRALQAEASAAGHLHAVARLTDASRARTVRRSKSAHDVTDGPYAETKEWLVGFYLVDCETEAQAIARAKQICPDAAHAVEVRPVGWNWEP